MASPIHSHRLARALTGSALAFLLGVAGLCGIAASAEAAPRTVVSAAAPAVVNLPSTVVVSGSVGGRSRGATVTLRRLVNRDWQVVQTARVDAARTYSLTAPVMAGINQFQVKVKKSKLLKRAGVSAPVVVSGISGSSSELTSARARILQDTNAFRAQNGRPALVEMSQLDTVAQNWTQYMATTGDFRHNTSFFAQFPGDPSAGAENVAYGYPLETVVGGWIASTGHRANLLGSYTHIGIGFARSTSGRTYFTQNFARY